MRYKYLEYYTNTFIVKWSPSLMYFLCSISIIKFLPRAYLLEEEKIWKYTPKFTPIFFFYYV